MHFVWTNMLVDGPALHVEGSDDILVDYLLIDSAECLISSSCQVVTCCICPMGGQHGR